MRRFAFPIQISAFQSFDEYIDLKASIEKTGVREFLNTSRLIETNPNIPRANQPCW
jgi:hypothetical protein